MAAICMLKILLLLESFYFMKAKPWTGETSADVKSISDNEFLCNKQIDIILLVDSFGSVLKQWNETIDNAEIFQSYFQISDNAIRLGIIDSGELTHVYTHLDSNNTNEEVYTILEKLRQRPQKGKKLLAFDMVVKLFESASPIRLESKKTVIVFTDSSFEHQRGEYQIYFDFFIRENISIYAIQVDNHFKVVDILKSSYNITGHTECDKSANNTACKVDSSETNIEKNSSMPKNWRKIQYDDPQPAMIHTITDKVGSIFSHNILRAMHGVAPLEWDDDIAYKASDFAYQLAVENTMRHSSMEGYGENVYLYRGSSSYVHSYRAVLQWYSSVRLYNFDKPGFNYPAGTFTQLIWKGAKKFGLGIAFRPDTKTTFIVAQYKPRSNMGSGDVFAANVFKPRAGLPARIPKLAELIPPSPFVKAFDLPVDEPGHGIFPKGEDEPLKLLAETLCDICQCDDFTEYHEDWSGAQSNPPSNK